MVVVSHKPLLSLQADEQPASEQPASQAAPGRDAAAELKEGLFG